MLTSISEFIDCLKHMNGVRDAHPMSREMVEKIVKIEDSITKVACGLRMENAGVGTCASKEHVFAVSCDLNFPRPSEITMEMIDDEGIVIGHDVPSSMIDEYRARDDTIWISESFVLYPSKVTTNDARMVLHASRLGNSTVPDDVEPWLFYPSTSSALKLNDAYGFEGKMLSTVMVGVDGLEDDSVPVSNVMQVSCGRCGHCESASENTFD